MADVVAETVAEGRARPFGLVAVDGGRLWWHPRADGQDPLAMVLTELLPLCADHGLGTDGRAVGVMGWSMGGYGALLAAETDPDRFVAAVAVSPAIVSQLDRAVGNAFDGPEDFAAHDVFAGAGRLADTAVRIDCGQRDPYYDDARAFAARLAVAPATDFSVGCHDVGYWRRVAPAEVELLSAAFVDHGSGAAGGP